MDAFSLVRLSSDCLYTIKTKGSKTSSFEPLSQLSFSDLLSLDHDQLKKAFWINMYNAWFQHLKAQKTPRELLFTKTPFRFKDFMLTLDEIEHGILRKLKPHPGQTDPFFSYAEEVQQLTLQTEDYRIHFALNCGTKSCPPIKFYSAVHIDEELHLATQSYLEQEASFDMDTNTATVNKLFEWYASDFGGRDGILKLLARYQVISQTDQFKLIFGSYDSTPALNDFA